MERFHLKKFNEADGKEKSHVEVSKRSVVMEGLDAEVENIRENTHFQKKRVKVIMN
jgi:hypothetical protein